MKNKYDWKKIQAEYDSGLSYKDIIEKYGMSSKSLHGAAKRGDFISRTRSEGVKLYLTKNPRSNITEKIRKNISKTIAAKVAAGTWHTSLAKKMHIVYKGIPLHGTWELKYAKYLDEMGIVWVRNTDSFSYRYEDKERRYTPDFYLPETDRYVEVKGYKTKKDDAKWSQFPPHRTLLVLMKKDLLSLGIDIK